MVKVVPLETAGPSKRLGFMAGQIDVPDGFDRMGQADIERLFAGDPHRELRIRSDHVLALQLTADPPRPVRPNSLGAGPR